MQCAHFEADGMLTNRDVRELDAKPGSHLLFTSQLSCKNEGAAS